ncbi:FAD-binding domain-containing protein [Thozetella sp. PMI_491]|nr:FAD-binding domain-containing protein [Thozetella sp. PMI_491]
MEVVAAGLSWALHSVSLQKVLRYIGLASLVKGPPWSELSSRLSSEASIVLAGDPTFANLTSRWREWHSPESRAVVRAFTEQDVQETIRYANAHGLPFVARSGGHGATEALASAQNAVMIDLRGIDQLQISEDGKHAWIGGGLSVKKLVHDLWSAGKQTVSGICECVGISAPILGGGHGWLQGQYGLAADQVLSARVILPNGDAVTASNDENPDLFWALKGAGHNFGIVTQWDYRIYDINNPKWSYEVFIFAGSKLEALVEQSAKLKKTQPPEPVIWYATISDGPANQAREFAKPIHDIGPLSVDAGELPMPHLAPVTFMDEKSLGCAKGSTGLRFPIGLDTYNVAAVRQVYDEMDHTFRTVPELSNSFFLLEAYPTQGVQAVDERSTAFPHRSDELLLTPFVTYLPNATMDPIAIAFGEKLRKYLLQGSADPNHLRAYVNYAHGDESLQEVYGWEDWRLEKLRDLKAKWDPENRMGFYNPIV